MKSAEVLIFRALLNPTYRGEAWKVVREPDLFLTGRAKHLAEQLKATLGEACPTGSAAEWLSRLTDDESVQLLTDLELGRDDRLNDEMLADTIALLRKKREERALQPIKETTGDDKLRELQERLKNLKA
jgi:hypothetical protein